MWGWAWVPCIYTLSSVFTWQIQSYFGHDHSVLAVFGHSGETGSLTFHFQRSAPCLPSMYNWARKGRQWGLGHNTFASFCSLAFTDTHTVHTFYFLDFSGPRVPSRVVCCHLRSLPLFSDKAHRGVDSMAPLAWAGSSSLSLRQNHLSQGQAVDPHLHLPTRNLCRVDVPGKGFLCAE